MSDYRKLHSRLRLFPCPWCEGKGITAGIFHAPMPMGMKLVCYDLKDTPCGQCGGTGTVTAQQYAQMTEE